LINSGVKVEERELFLKIVQLICSYNTLYPSWCLHVFLLHFQRLLKGKKRQHGGGWLGRSFPTSEYTTANQPNESNTIMPISESITGHLLTVGLESILIQIKLQYLHPEKTTRTMTAVC
jgi:hypothetical protein